MLAKTGSNADLIEMLFVCSKMRSRDLLERVVEMFKNAIKNNVNSPF